MRSKFKNLLIIGNGFDLHCRLQSSFSQFFKYYDKCCNSNLIKLSKNKINSWFNKIFKDSQQSFFHNLAFYNEYSYLKEMFDEELQDVPDCIDKTWKEYPNYKSQSNFFIDYFILLDHESLYLSNKYKLYNWTDIENQLYILLNKYVKYINQIAKVVCKSLGTDEFNWSHINELLDKWHNNIKYNKFDFYIIITFSSLFALSTGIVHWHKNNKSDKKAWYGYISEDIYDFLLSQLEDFEKIFSKYIKYEEKKMSKKHNYISNVQKTLEYIKINNGNYPQNILSFNYTKLNEAKYYKNRQMFDDIKHVHSIYGEDPIIGIDSSISINKPYYMFTKTYRTLNLINDHIQSHSNYNKRILPTKNKSAHNTIKNIIFYGHSLGRQDYSYFLSIFDYYHIYDSNVNLVFYYSYPPHTKARDVLKSQYKNIFNLINKYGSSINHGNNLLHKLVLEDRIHIKCIPSIFKFK